MATTTKPRSVGLVAACDDRRLFGFELWPVQRRLLEGVERGPRIHVWALGRRSAKSTTGALVGLHACTLRPELRAHLRPGERGYAIAVATNLRQARLIVSAARSIVERSPLLRGLVEQVTEDEIAFSNGMSFAAFPCTSRGGRGWPIHTLVLDEAAHHVDTEGNSAAESVWRALVPSTAQFGEQARVVVASTPWGQDGLFADLYQRASSGEIADATAVHATTAEANPRIDPAFLQREHARDPEGFRGEYEAMFVGGGAAYLDPDKISDAVADRGELAPEHAVRWVLGIDPAFSSDPFGAALVGNTGVGRWNAPARLLLGMARAWKPSRRKAGSFEERREVEDEVLGQVVEIALRFDAEVVSDQYLASAVTERLRRAGVRIRVVPMTAASKTEAFSELRARLYDGSLELYDHADLLTELRRLRSRFTAGHASVVNPRVGGSHGDMAQALALAVHAMRGPTFTDDSASWGWAPTETIGAGRRVAHY